MRLSGLDGNMGGSRYRRGLEGKHIYYIKHCGLPPSFVCARFPRLVFQNIQDFVEDWSLPIHDKLMKLPPLRGAPRPLLQNVPPEILETVLPKYSGYFVDNDPRNIWDISEKRPGFSKISRIVWRRPLPAKHEAAVSQVEAICFSRISRICWKSSSGPGKPVPTKHEAAKASVQVLC